MRISVAAAALLVTACRSPAPRGELAELFPESPRPLDLQYPAGTRHIHYVEVPQVVGTEIEAADHLATQIIFIHGSPGRWQDMAELLRSRSLRTKATLIAVDRPGWGESDGGQMLPNVEAQARLLEPLLNNFETRSLLVGYSYGGSLALTMALDFPEQIRGAVLVAPALDPQLERRWYYSSTLWWIVRELTPTRFARSNRELLPLSMQLAQLQPRLHELKVPVTLIQGDDDDQVDPRTAAFAERELPASLLTVVRVPEADHYLIWRRPQQVIDATLALLQKTRSAKAGEGNAG